MDSISSTLGFFMHDIVAACQTPVVVLVLIIAAFVLCCVGSLIFEFFTEHQRFKVFLPKLVDQLMLPDSQPEDVIKQSGLLLRQKRYLIELTRHANITNTARESLAVGLEYQEQRRYDGITKITDIMARIAPMLGLLGTLIPLGPGIIALSSGDTLLLSESLRSAFDTTALGVMVGLVALVVSAVRKRWYKDYMVSFDAAMEWTLEKLRNHSKERAI